MTRIAESARITLKGFQREGIDHNSPLEDQCALVYKAARHYAMVNGFETHVHFGPKGAVKGVKGPLVMKRMVSDLFPNADENQIALMNGYINQVLRKTDAAVCIYQPHKKNERPIWFIADQMPAHLTVVALNQSKKTDVPVSHEETWRDKVEARLTPEEAGETVPPGEVSVTFKEPSQHLKQSTSFEDSIAERTQAHAKLLDEIVALIERSPVPLHGREIHHLLGGDEKLELTTVRAALVELRTAGRLAIRIEEDSERLVRGGGTGMPKGARVTLYWPTEPVPLRDTLPDGIEPNKPAADWDAERRRFRAEATDKVLEVMTSTYAGARRPVTVPKIAEAAGLNKELTRSILHELVDIGLAYRAPNNQSEFRLTDARRTQGEQEQVLEPAEPEEPEAPAPVTPVNKRNLINRNLATLRSQINGLFDELEGDDSFQVTDLQNRITQLEAENKGLADENARLKDAIDGLKKAIASLSN